MARQPMPVYQLLKAQLTKEVGVHGTRCEQLAMAIASLAPGTARGMIAAGERYTCGQPALPYAPSCTATFAEAVFGFTYRA